MIAGATSTGCRRSTRALVKLVKEGLVSRDEARRTATNPHDFDLALHGTLERTGGVSPTRPPVDSLTS